MSLGKLAVLVLAVVLAGGGIAAAFSDSRSLPAMDPIDVSDQAVRKDDAGDVVLPEEDDDDDRGDGDRTAGNDGTRGGDNTGDGDRTAGNDGTSGGNNTGAGGSDTGGDVTTGDPT